MSVDFVTFKLGDDPVEYKLKFDFNELCKAEQITGCNLLTALGRGNYSAAEARGLLFACLRTAHDVTIEEAGSLLSRDINTVFPMLRKALAVDAEETTEVATAAS